jgi:putative transposase
MTDMNIMPCPEELFKKFEDSKDGDLLKLMMTYILNQLMESEVSTKVGAEKYERNEERVNKRNGTRSRTLNTRAGTLEIDIPKLRSGNYFPSFLEPRRLWEKAMVNVIQEAYIKGVSTRKVDALVKAMGMDGIDKSTVSRISKEIDDKVNQFLSSRFTKKYPYIWLDATFPNVREEGQVQGMAFVVAIGVASDGQREVLGFDIGMSESEPFWKSFLRKLVDRGLHGVKLVISDAHAGLKSAIKSTFHGASWQRCRVHFMRNVLSNVTKKSQPMVSTIVRTIFSAPDQQTAKQQLVQVINQLKGKYPGATKVLDEGGDDVLTYMAFPEAHHRQIHSTNPLERLNREIKRRIDVVSIFPDRPSVMRLVGALLIEQHEEWLVGRKYFSKETMYSLVRDSTEVEPLYELAASSLLHK